jgi:hypothetical protein
MNLSEDMFTFNVPQEGVGGQPAGGVEGQPAEGAAAASQDRGCGCTLWAVVNANGALLRNFRAIQATRIGLGVYRVRFNRNVTQCSYQATIGLAGVGLPPPGEISVARANGFADGVIVTTYLSSGAGFADRPFHLAVHCRPQS